MIAMNEVSTTTFAELFKLFCAVCARRIEMEAVGRLCLKILA